MRVEVRVAATILAILLFALWIDRRLAEMDASARRRERRMIDGTTRLMAAIYGETKAKAKP